MYEWEKAKVVKTSDRVRPVDLICLHHVSVAAFSLSTLTDVGTLIELTKRTVGDNVQRSGVGYGQLREVSVQGLL